MPADRLRPSSMLFGWDCIQKVSGMDLLGCCEYEPANSRSKTLSERWSWFSLKRTTVLVRSPDQFWNHTLLLLHETAFCSHSHKKPKSHGCILSNWGDGTSQIYLTTLLSAIFFLKRHLFCQFYLHFHRFLKTNRTFSLWTTETIKRCKETLNCCLASEKNDDACFICAVQHRQVSAKTADFDQKKRSSDNELRYNTIYPT